MPQHISACKKFLNISTLIGKRREDWNPKVPVQSHILAKYAANCKCTRTVARLIVIGIKVARACRPLA
jgi:hypothetical protein